MKKQISSEMTGFLRWMFAIMFTLGGAGGLFAVVTLRSSFGVLVAPMAIWVGVAILLGRRIWSCRRVAMTDEGLLVGKEERAIRFEDIARVQRSYLGRPPMVTLHLDSGERVRFFAPYQFAGWSMPPIVTELAARSAQARESRASLPVARTV